MRSLSCRCLSSAYRVRIPSLALTSSARLFNMQIRHPLLLRSRFPSTIKLRKTPYSLSRGISYTHQLFGPFWSFTSKTVGGKAGNNLLYDILGVNPKATQSEIKIAFTQLCKKYHPDVNDGKYMKFLEITKAYEFLKNPEERKQFDDLSLEHYKLFVTKWRSEFDPTKEKVTCKAIESKDSGTNILAYIRTDPYIHKPLKYTHLYVLQDVSNSMNQTKVTYSSESLKKFLWDLKTRREINVNIVEFNYEMDFKCHNKSIKEVLEMYGNENICSYKGDQTALYSSLNQCIEQINQLDSINHTLFVVITSGYDNWGFQKLSEIIDKMENHKVNIMFMAVDMLDVRHLISISKAASRGAVLKVNSDEFPSSCDSFYNKIKDELLLPE